MAVFKKHERISSNRSNSGRTSKLTDRDRHAVSTKAVGCELNKTGYLGRVAIRKLLFSTKNIQKSLKWCIDHKGWSDDPIENRGHFLVVFWSAWSFNVKQGRISPLLVTLTLNA